MISKGKYEINSAIEIKPDQQWIADAVPLEKIIRDPLVDIKNTLMGLRVPFPISLNYNPYTFYSMLYISHVDYINQ